MTNSSTPPTARLLRGIGATSLSPVVTSIIQLGTVPLLLHAWGVTKYGDWLLLSAVPSYLSFSGLGFGDSSGSEMTMQVASGDRRGALETFQSLWALLTSISLVVLSTAAALVWWIPWQQALHLAGLTNHEAAAILLTLAAWVIAGQQSGVIESGYRCDGNFALGTFCATLQRLAEAVFGTVVGVVTHSLLAMAVSFLVVRLIGVLIYWLLLKSRSPWIKLGVSSVRFSVIRRMIKPSFGFLILPMGNALSIQGFTVLVGLSLGPAAVTAFSTARTLTRVGIQLINAIANGIWPEFSRAFGAADIARARTLHRHAYQASLVLAVSCAAGLWLFGPYFYQLWVGRSVALDTGCFHVLLLVTIVNSLWYASAIVQMSSNTHSNLAVLYLTLTVVSCGIGYLLIPKLGLSGAALALLLIDIVMCAFVLRKSLRQMEDTPIEFFRAVFGSTPVFVRPLMAGLGFKR